MADPVLGLYTSDDIASEALRTEFMDSVRLYNEEARDFRTELCKITTDNTVRVRQRSMRFERMGSDTALPDFQHQDYAEIAIAKAVRYGLRSGMTAAAWEEEHPDADTLRGIHKESLAADRRLTTQLVLYPMLIDGGWYDATMTVVPPPYAMNTFLTTHDHYLVADAGGVPAYTHFTYGKRHIQEHGFGMTTNNATRLVAFINGVQAEYIENVADWVDATNTRMDTELLEVLQKLGLTPSFTVAGIAVVKNDWIPENYMTIFDPGEKVGRYRVTDNPTTRELIVYMEEDGVQYKGLGSYIRWGKVGVARRGAGITYYLGDDAWTDPTGFEV